MLKFASLLLPLALTVMLAVARGNGGQDASEGLDTGAGDGSAGQSAFERWARLDAAERPAGR